MKRLDEHRFAAALVNKRWDLLAEYKDQAVRDDKRLGFAAILRKVDDMLQHARALAPSWPTEQQREQDLEAHRRLAAALAKTTPAATRPTRRLDRRPHRVR